MKVHNTQTIAVYLKFTEAPPSLRRNVRRSPVAASSPLNIFKRAHRPSIVLAERPSCRGSRGAVNPLPEKGGDGHAGALVQLVQLLQMHDDCASSTTGLGIRILSGYDIHLSHSRLGCSRCALASMEAAAAQSLVAQQGRSWPQV